MQRVEKCPVLHYLQFFLKKWSAFNFVQYTGIAETSKTDVLQMSSALEVNLNEEVK